MTYLGLGYAFRYLPPLGAAHNVTAKGRKFCERLLANLQERFKDPPVQVLLALMVDPRCSCTRLLPIIFPGQADICQRAYDALVTALHAVPLQPRVPQPGVPTLGDDLPRLDEHDEPVGVRLWEETEATTRLPDVVRTELRQFLQDTRRVWPASCDPLDWWKAKRYDYPHIAVIAHNVMSIPATSAPSERIFSTVTYLTQGNRCRVSFDKLDAYVSLRDTVLPQATKLATCNKPWSRLLDVVNRMHTATLFAEERHRQDEEDQANLIAMLEAEAPGTVAHNLALWELMNDDGESTSEDEGARDANYGRNLRPRLR